ncbi:MAG: site-2 protease family protein [Pirellulales bacterium]|nr:site-2 protease family protein [Pirellulales bacterium]
MSSEEPSSGEQAKLPAAQRAEQSPSTPPAPPLPVAIASPPAIGVTPAAVPRGEPDYSHLPELKLSDLHFRPQRRRLLPLLLFVGTCASTFWVGCTHWRPLEHPFLSSYAAMWEVISANWLTGVQYMVAVLAILLTHEMGHFLQTVKHRIAASYPLCIPIPFNAIGTMGAVIGMDGMRADRRQIFDIGIAGPLAGLVVAVPVFWWGISDLDLSHRPRADEIQLYLPWIGQWMLAAAHPEWTGRDWIGLSQLNPCFMAGWVGMLITGLNMLPISQLDGGHTIYALFLDRAHTLARWFVSLSIFYILVHINDAVMWTPMLVLVILMGIHHPPTANDNVPLGPVRWAIGLASLVIPLLCFPLQGVRQ